MKTVSSSPTAAKALCMLLAFWVLTSPSSAHASDVEPPAYLLVGPAIGVGLFVGALIAYHAAEVEMDGLFVPSTIAWVELVAAATMVGGAALSAEAGMPALTIGLSAGSTLFAAHGLLSLLVYEAEPSSGTGDGTPELSVWVLPQGGALVRGELRF